MKACHTLAVLVLSRQALPTIDRKKYAPASGVQKGAYVLADASDGKPAAVMLATGSEVGLCLQAYEQLDKEGIKTRVVSMPSWEIFDQQEQAYRDSVIPPSITARVAVEQASTFCWERWVGSGGAIIAQSTVGASAPLKELQKQIGVTLENVGDTGQAQIEK